MLKELNLSEKQIKIIEAALLLLTEKGLSDLSLRDIAKKLDMKAAAIYWHFKNKAILLDYMAEFILRKQMSHLQPRKENECWFSWLLDHVCLFRESMLSYPDGGRVVAGAHLYPTRTLAKFMDYSIQSLTSTGMDIKKAGALVMTAIHYTFGYVIEEQSGEHSAKKGSQKYLLSLHSITQFINVCDSKDAFFVNGLKLILKSNYIQDKKPKIIT